MNLAPPFWFWWLRTSFNNPSGLRVSGLQGIRGFRILGVRGLTSSVLLGQRVELRVVGCIASEGGNLWAWELVATLQMSGP